MNGSSINRLSPMVGRNRDLRWLYFAAFLAAAIGSFVLSLLGFSWAPAAWAAVCMLGYLAIAHYREPQEVRSAEFADNFYYFGFLLTLVSLFGVLVQLGLNEAHLGDALLRTVLSQFGLALVTTIIGLVVRTVILMRSRNVDDLEARAEAHLSGAFDDFVHSLNRLTAEADAFSQSFGEHLRSIMSGVERSVGEFGTIVSTTAAQLEPMHTEIRAASDSISQSAGGVAQATNELTDEIRQSAGVVRDSFNGFSSAANNALDELVQSTLNARDSLQAATSGAQQPIAEIRSHMADFGRELTEVSAAFTRLPNEIGGVVTISSGIIESLLADVSALRDAVAKVQTAVLGVADSLQGENNAVQRSVASLVEQIHALERVHARLAEEAEGSSKAIVAVRKELAWGVDRLVETLQPAGEHPSEGTINRG